ncbi:MAG TPA: ImmA/IrrE family metallo-endopeptidase [Candidatus Acetothermia bacterium]|nr:ImmA/IrrE family metallo-endopeptidase [Candidatus Acetothermia bacterium]
MRTKVEKEGEKWELGRRLKQAREAAGYTQEQAAKLLGISRSTLADVEVGRGRVDTVLLRKLAALYGKSPWELLGSAPEAAQVRRAAAQVRDTLLNELDKVGVSFDDRREILEFWGTLERFARLRQELELEPETPAVKGLSDLGKAKLIKSRTPDFVIEAEADRARHALGLDDAPIGNFEALRYRLESLGVPVFLWPLDPDPISGLYVRHPELGPVVLVNASQLRWRRVFTLAHEFGHVWLHRHEHVMVGRIFTGQDSRAIERQANTFAAEFLMPEEAIKRTIALLGIAEPTPEDVVRLHRYFGVSYKAMLVRLHRLRIIRRDRLEELERVSPVRLAHELGYPWPEDIWKGPEKPEVPFHERLPGRYVQAVVRAFEEGRLGEGKAIELLGTDYYSFHNYLKRTEEAARRQQRESVPADIGG